MRDWYDEEVIARKVFLARPEGKGGDSAKELKCLSHISLSWAWE